MSKGSGSTRGSNSNNPRGLNVGGVVSLKLLGER